MQFSHLDEQGRARMVDVSEKPDTRRAAAAAALVRMAPATVDLIRNQALAKGDVMAVARVAGILAAKQTPFLIPMCHPLPLTEVRVDLELGADGVAIRSHVSTVGKTGVEMEALTAAAAAALAVYDMCKAVDKSMTIEGIRVLEKSGGKSDWPRERA
jgi:cyclic pyranopterin phosphate synthase